MIAKIISAHRKLVLINPNVYVFATWPSSSKAPAACLSKHLFAPESLTQFLEHGMLHIIFALHKQMETRHHVNVEQSKK